MLGPLFAALVATEGGCLDHVTIDDSCSDSTNQEIEDEVTDIEKASLTLIKPENFASSTPNGSHQMYVDKAGNTVQCDKTDAVSSVDFAFKGGGEGYLHIGTFDKAGTHGLELFSSSAGGKYTSITVTARDDGTCQIIDTNNQKPEPTDDNTCTLETGDCTEIVSFANEALKETISACLANAK